jgi:Na+/H+-dicarboxylate symporter
MPIVFRTALATILLQVHRQCSLEIISVHSGNLLLPLLILPLIYLIIAQSNPVKFFGQMGEALLVNFGTASSISTFPVTLRCLTEKNKMDHKVGVWGR